MKVKNISLHRCYNTKTTTELLGLSPTSKLNYTVYRFLKHVNDPYIGKGYTGKSIVETIKNRRQRIDTRSRVSSIWWDFTKGINRASILIDA